VALAAIGPEYDVDRREAGRDRELDPIAGMAHDTGLRRRSRSPEAPGERSVSE
jgi:hypothetical protein